MAETSYPPFLNSYGTVKKILDLVKDAQTPTRFTQDFIKQLVGYESGKYEAMIPLMKRIGLLASDGTPTDLYRRFRNPSESGRAMAEALRKGYHQLYTLKENAHTLQRAELDGLITQITGLPKESSTVRAIAKTFEALKGYAAFDGVPHHNGSVSSAEAVSSRLMTQSVPTDPSLPPLAQSQGAQEVGMNLSYTINLNLPETTNVAVFNAIFAALKSHLLRK